MKKHIKFIIFMSLFIVIGFVISWALLHQLRLDQNKLINERFVSKIKTSLFAIKEGYSQTEAVVESADGFFIASDYVSLQEWKKYNSTLNFEKKFPEIKWISFVKYLPNSEIKNFLQTFNEYPDNAFKIWPEESHSFYAPITYIYPSNFQNLIGFNLYSELKLRKILEKSIQKKSEVTSDPIIFQPSKARNSERLIYYPIIKKNENSTDFFGWITANIDFSTIIKKAAEGTLLTDIEITAYAGDTPSYETLIYEKKSSSNLNPLFTVTKTIEFAGANWTFIFSTAPDFASKSIGLYPFFLFIFSFILLIAFVTFLYFRYFPSSKINSDFSLMLIENIPYSLIATDLNGNITFINNATEKLLGYTKEEMINKMTPLSVHDSNEVKQRANELSSILGRTIEPSFEVFVALSKQGISENRRWIYIRKNQSQVPVQLSFSEIKDVNNQTIGYLGVAIEASQIKL